MGEQNTRNPKPKEIVGSKDLRESFKDTGRIRGSFFINHIEMHQFEANSPASVAAQINAKTGQHFVTAEIDDGGHLVLIDKSGADIAIRQGEPYSEAPPISTGDVGRDVVRNLRHEEERRRGDDGKNHILEMLGLEATAEAGADVTPAPGFETGRSAEDREKEYQDSLKPNSKPEDQSVRPATRDDPKRFAPQIPSNPTPGVGSAGGQLEDGRGRTGTGGGSGESSGSGIGHRGQPSSQGSAA